jgi:hypothetical protein
VPLEINQNNNPSISALLGPGLFPNSPNLINQVPQRSKSPITITSSANAPLFSTQQLLSIEKDRLILALNNKELELSQTKKTLNDLQLYVAQNNPVTLKHYIKELANENISLCS